MEIIAIHGNSMSVKTMEGLSFLTKNLSLPGHDGVELEEEYNLINLSNYLVNQIGDDDVVLIGNSLGAILAHQIADRVNLKALISIGTPPLNYDVLEGAVQQNECTSLAYTSDLNDDQCLRFAQQMSDDEEAQKIIYKAAKVASPIVRSAMMASVAQGHLRDERKILKALNIPMLFIMCEDDKVVNNDKFKNLEFGEVISMKGGHILVAERPVEVSRVILDFLGKHNIKDSL